MQLKTITLLILFLTFSLIPNPSNSKEFKKAFRNEEVLASFTYSLRGYVTWPISRPLFNICVIGSNSVAKILENIVESKNMEQKILIRRLNGYTKEFSNCEIIYIDSSVENIPSILELTSKKPILTVSDSSRFVKLGGIIQFDVREDSVAVIASRESLRQSTLSINSDLLGIIELTY